ncbi:right-handed parallel beta-helix repeat-containing protein [Rhodobacteraceae bacterium B1Z28]|uniref:Right-handed parallel beta-helix repeat-containing protein n=1 Tax=Ruegeria haliotis TaxID=2747601 RepID=A0ABX2PVP0_9RHOB|nr:DUF6519 domain-containing protein [Ruegeria haliotis]NVO58257.1 right-handed parallel beta-helix repeat-containing protein [Ruegeria haliotis]
MSGDYSRDSFDALRDFAGVFLQQGRAVLDADWNEMVQIFQRRIRAGTVDTIGRCVVPRETEDAFEIQIVGNSIEIGPGRIYHYGKLVQNSGFANFDGTIPARPDPVFDRGTDVEDGPAGVLDEMIAPPDGPWLPYEEQPYWPTPDALPGENTTSLAYLVSWQREVTPVKDPSLLEPAMGGIDTTTRLQTVWQVRMLADVGDNATCETPDDELDDWIETIAPSTARLSSATIDIDDPEDPCLVPPTEGYTGIENQFYRVELHATEEDTPPTRFKFSRENASVTATVEAIANPAASVTVSRIGRDEVLRFAAGDWVEITDNIREFNHRSGQMLRVANVNPETREIEFEAGQTVDADLVPSGGAGDTFVDRRTRMIRWDQRGIIRLADNTEWEDLGAGGSDGLIPIPPDGTAVILENGITVTFDTVDGPGTFRDMDYWRFAARTAGTQIEELRSAPPDGIQRHYCRLAIVRFPNSVQDCRVFWPPEFEGGEAESCGCTVCVTAEGHNSGALTIQAAIDQVGAQGGTVCLDAGGYVLTDPVTINGRTAIKVVGQGIGTLLFYQGVGGAFQINNSFDIQLERFSLFVAPGEDPAGNLGIAHGIAAINTALLAVRRVAILLLSPNPEDSFDFGIALDGIQIGAKIEECLIIAPHAIGSRSTYGLDEDGDLTFVALAELRMLDCILLGGRVTLLFDRVALNIALAEFARNLIFGLERAVVIRFAEVPAASTQIDSNTIIANRTALRLGSNDIRVQDCEVSGGDEAGDGIVLTDGLVPELRTDAQIVGNNIFDLAGTGIRIEGFHDAILIKRNMIRRCGAAGITVEADADIRHLAIDNNVVEDIAGTVGPENAGGIIVGAGDNGQIIGNQVRAIGQGGIGGQTFAGIGVQGVGSLAIESNAISEIGPDQPEARAYAILIRPPYEGLIVNANRITGASEVTANDLTGWLGIHIGTDPPTFGSDLVLGPPVLAHVASIPRAELRAVGFVEFEGTLVRFAPARFRANPSRGTSNQIGLSGNQVRNRSRIGQPMIRVFDAQITSLAVAQNQCILNGRGGLSEVVLLGAQRLVVTGNTITHNTDALSLRLAGTAATVIGNITTAGIALNSANLPAPFDALNVIA